MFYSFVQKLHGHRAANALKNLNHFSKKLVIANCRKIFLLACRRADLIPNFINFKYDHILHRLVAKKGKASKIVENFKFDILNVCIEDVHVYVRNISQRIISIINFLHTVIPNFVLADFLSTISLRNEKLKGNVNRSLASKFTALKQRALDNYHKLFQPFLDKKDSWVQNISDTQLPSFAMRVLCLGPKFCIPFFKNSLEKSPFRAVPLEKIIVGIESKIRFEPTLVDTVRDRVCHAIKTYTELVKRVGGHENINSSTINLFKECFYTRTLKKDIIDTFHFIKNNPQIKIINGDKTNKTVIVNSVDYREKMRVLLDDASTYKQIRHSLIPAHIAKNNFLVKKWFDQDFISKNLFENLKVSGAGVSRIYGLIKLHKENFPLRPIVSSIGSPFYALSKFFTTVLSNIVGDTDCHVANSFEFFESVNNQEIPDGYKLISLDVTSMYTNISSDLALECVSRRWDEIGQHCSVPKDQFLYALKVCLESTVFQFEDKFFHQIRGLAMGGSVSAVLANIVMEDFELEILGTISFLILFYKRYVDDLFLVVHEDTVVPILHFFNSKNPSIQFTLEEEVNQSINFLDMTVSRVNNVLKCKWYQKPSSSGRLLNFLSVQPFIYKRNVVTNLAQRIFRLSDRDFTQTTANLGKRILMENCYPAHLINREFSKVSEKNYHEKAPSRNKVDFSKLISLPYVPFLSERLSAILKSFGFPVVHKQYNNLGFLMSQLKSERETEQMAEVVYHLKCQDCEIGYIGQTKQLLKKRLNGHKYDKNEKTALHHHENTLHHHFDFNSVRVLATEKNCFARSMLEMIHILRQKNHVCNSRADVNGLSGAYHQFFLSEEVGD